MTQKICNGLISTVTCRKALGNNVHIIIHIKTKKKKKKKEAIFFRKRQKKSISQCKL